MGLAPKMNAAKSPHDYLPEPGSFRGSMSQFDITPRLNKKTQMFVQGFAGPPRQVKRVITPLLFQMFLLEDDHYNKLLIISADIFGFDQEVVRAIRSIAAGWGIAPEAVVINASHTHYAPGAVSRLSQALGPFYQNMAVMLINLAAKALPELYASLERCEIFVGRAQAQIGANRRVNQDGRIVFGLNQEGYYHQHTPVLRVHFLERGMNLVLVNHGCHPTGLGTQGVISADFPAYLRASLAKHEKVDLVMFLQGALGSSKQTAFNRDGVVFGTDNKAVMQNGEYLARKVAQVIDEGLAPVSGSIFAMEKRAGLPLRPLPSRQELTVIKESPQSSPIHREWAARNLELLEGGGAPEWMSMPVQVVGIGREVTMVTFPAEPVAELARSIGKVLGEEPEPFILGCTNGLLSYLPTDEMIGQGGHEAHDSFFSYLVPSGLDVGGELEIARVVKEGVALKNDESAPAYGRFHLGLEKTGPAFFSLSTGRTGTMTLAHALATAQNAVVHHEPHPNLVEEILKAYWGQIDQAQTFWRARYAFLTQAWSEGKVYGEAGHLMTQFAGEVARQVPGSRFIVLTRDPRQFVRSGMRRDYYHNHAWDVGRLRPREGSQQFEEWVQLTQFEKVAWLWRATHESILETVEAIGQDRVVTVRFEDLIKGPRTVRMLFDFLELEGYDEAAVTEVLGRRMNEQTKGEFPRVEDWTPDQHDKVWKHCGDLAEGFGYVR